jgi:hypothetical protein
LISTPRSHANSSSSPRNATLSGDLGDGYETDKEAGESENGTSVDFNNELEGWKIVGK